MSNPNENTNYRRERQESHNDANGNTHVTKTSETVNNTPSNVYQDGYIQGRVSENHYQQEVLTERDNENASRGLLLGILLTSLAALTAGALWFLNQKDEVVEPASQTTIIAPKPSAKPSPQPSVAPEKTTVIEKTKEVPVVVPQAPAPASAPDINITLPSPAVVPAPASETQKESKSTTSTTTVTPTTPSSSDPSATPSKSTTSTTDSSTSTSTSSGDSTTAD